jgi:hypothetical protein
MHGSTRHIRLSEHLVKHERTHDMLGIFLGLSVYRHELWNNLLDVIMQIAAFYEAFDFAFFFAI